MPRLWGDVSDGHLELMHSTMADLHREADERDVDFSKLPVDRSGWDRFLDKDMLDDQCVDWMAKCSAKQWGRQCQEQRRKQYPLC